MMDVYIPNVLAKYGHIAPSKLQLSTHKHREIIYGSTSQITPDETTSPKINGVGVNRVQGTIDALLYYAWAVDKKTLVLLIEIGSQQDDTTTKTAYSIDQLL